MKTKRFLLVLIIICITLSACDSILQFEPPENRYRYTISTSFVVESDREMFEKRLSACGFQVVEREENDGQYRFVLYSQYGWDENCLKLLGKNFEASVIDKNGNALVTDADVLSMEYSRVSLHLTTSSDLNKKLHEEYDMRTINLVVDGSISNVGVFFDIEEKLSIGIRTDESPAVLCKAMIAFSKAPLSAEIAINVLSS